MSWTKVKKRSYARKYRKTYYPAHKAEILTYQALRQLLYPKKQAEYCKTWRKRNPVKFKKYQKNYWNRYFQRNEVGLRLYWSLRDYLKTIGEW